MIEADRTVFVSHLVTEITHNLCVLEKGRRSPARVGKLLEVFNPLDLRAAISMMKDRDARLYRQLKMISEHHVRRARSGNEFVDWSAAEETWKGLKARLQAFADQEGGQVLVARLDAIELLRKSLQNVAQSARRSEARLTS